MDDYAYMKMALSLAEKGRGFTSPNPMVGAVVVKNDKVVGKGWHEKAGLPHAEVNAINDAGSMAEGATIYVTLEPCNHHGRTPPCTEKILAAGIRRVVVALADPNPDVAGGGLARLNAEGLETVSGILEQDAAKQNEVFLKYIQTGLPFVILKNAVTLDGRTATRDGDSKWITGPKSRRFVHMLRHQVDAIMVGIGTVRADNPSLTTRLEGFEGKDPVRIILDTRLSISEDANLLQLDSNSGTVIVCGKFKPQDKKKRLIEKGAQVLETELQNGLIDLEALMPRLGKMGITSLLIEGGSHVSTSAMNAKIVDKVYFFYAPKILGGDDGVPVFQGKGPALMRQSVPIRDVSVRRFEDDVMIEGYVRY